MKAVKAKKLAGKSRRCAGLNPPRTPRHRKAVAIPHDEDRLFLRATTRPVYEMGEAPVTIVDLFSGCGGMTLGVAHAAHVAGRATHVALAMDTDSAAIDAFKNNFSEGRTVVGDVRDWFDGELGSRLTRGERNVRRKVGRKIDFLVGGPPCQGNSDLNNHTRHNDRRNALYARMARAARVLDARVVVIENVPAVLRDRGRVVDLTCEALRTSGFLVAQTVLDLRLVGVPQSRKRHVVIATRESGLDPIEVVRDLKARVPVPGRTVQWAIEDLKHGAIECAFNSASVHSAENAKRMAWLFKHGEHDLPNRLRPPCHQNNSHTYKSTYGRMRWDEPAQTITTGFGSMGQGRYVHPSIQRTITPHEAARLQCIPDFFSFGTTTSRSAWSRLIGNAVPPFLTMRIAEAMLEQLPGARA